MKFGLIGHPIAHSLSPALFGAGYDGRFPYDLIQGEDFEASYQRLIEEYDGINVTAPFKELAYAKADLPSEECRLIKATNLLIKTPEGVRAYNSDFLGVRLWLIEVLGGNRASSDAVPLALARCSENIEAAMAPVERSGTVCPSGLSAQCADWGWKSHPTILIVGCGGAGKAAAAAAASLGMKVVLMNRNHERAVSLANDLNGAGYDAEAVEISEFCRCFNDADVVIYNVPTAIPQMQQLLMEPLHPTATEAYHPTRTKHILEANYKDPSFDEAYVKSLQEVNLGVRYTGGRTWLLYQALTGYEIFTGEKPDLQKMSDVL